MGNWDRPPVGIPIAEFFETWLPAAYQATARHAPENAPSVRAMISGPGGGGWDLEAEDDRLTVTAAGREAPDVLVRQSHLDFRAAFDGDPDLPVLIPPGWTALDLLFLDAREAESLKSVQGRILLELGGRRGRRWSLDV